MKRFANVTDEGTAVAETTLCGNCIQADENKSYVRYVINPIDVFNPEFVDVTENDACQCIICGG